MNSGWIGSLSYDLGRVIEPLASGDSRSLTPDPKFPLIEFGWCPNLCVFDHVLRQWFAVGDPPCWTATVQPVPRYRLKAWKMDEPKARYVSNVKRAIDYIGAGDVYQTTVAHRLSAPFRGSSRGLGIHALTSASPWYGAMLEFDDESCARRIISLSPELFLQVESQTRRVTTRPIKGTRATGTNADDLTSSGKDAAELHMIVDLMRNDLGRVCEIGSVQVPEPRLIELHPTVQHGVGEVTGQLRPGITAGQLLRATFPGGSVTGVPKIRAMQIIDELESSPRGPYCGTIGWFGDCGSIQLSVAIRTMMIEGKRDKDGELDGVARYWAGAGIVADSHPALEFEETLVKAEVIRGLRDRSAEATSAPELRRSCAAPPPPAASVPVAEARCSGRFDQPRISGDLD